jgi:cytochrome P450
VEERFDPYDPEHLRSGVPFDLLARLRRDQPVSPTTTGAWYVAREADVRSVLREVDTFRTDLGPITGLAGIEDVPDDQLFLSEISGVRHGEVRRLYNACFGPHRVREVAPYVIEVCDGLLERLLADDPADLAAYAAPIPALVIAHMMGLGDGAAERWMAWSADGTLMTRPATPAMQPDGPPIHAWFAEQLAAQREKPEGERNAVFQTLLGATVEGAPLSDTEIVTQLHFMVMAGVHTTRGLLTHVVQRLALDPQLFARLRADLTLVPVYVEESLRVDAPVQRTTRRVLHDAELAGVALRKGEWVEVGVASANRDEAVHDDPESFRLDRPDPRDHVAFGAGPHVCPGATLARLEATTAIEVLLRGVAAIDPVPGAQYPPLPGNLGHAPIPVRLHPA